MGLQRLDPHVRSPLEAIINPNPRNRASLPDPVVDKLLQWAEVRAFGIDDTSQVLLLLIERDFDGLGFFRGLRDLIEYAVLATTLGASAVHDKQTLERAAEYVQWAVERLGADTVLALFLKMPVTSARAKDGRIALRGDGDQIRFLRKLRGPDWSRHDRTILLRYFEEIVHTEAIAAKVADKTLKEIQFPIAGIYQIVISTTPFNAALLGSIIVCGRVFHVGFEANKQPGANDVERIYI